MDEAENVTFPASVLNPDSWEMGSVAVDAIINEITAQATGVSGSSLARGHCQLPQLLRDTRPSFHLYKTFINRQSKLCLMICCPISWVL